MQPGEADTYFFGGRVPVTRRTTLDDVADVDLLSLEAGFSKHTFQELPGWSDEGSAETVLISARGFSDHDDFCIGVSFPENHTGSCRVESTCF